MNFLAHAYLSFDHPKILVGNFIGDFVRGDLKAQFDKDIVIGIMLHREIDSYTDQHEVVKEAQEILKPYFSRYSVVITDVFFDYFLSRDWDQYHSKPIFKFAQEVYGLLDAHREILPSSFLHMYQFMKQENWLVAYGTMDGMKKSFTGISKKTSFRSKLEEAPRFLDAHRETFFSYFQAFFPELINFSRAKLQEIQQNYDTLQT
ncbi:acyl carrier protein phosphodiesterase [Pleomorphovibrio marinus]|uniref:acyl carrier protein phosphodiesterase n=1 Tax=Pleomorphovibrio marinus TaxID=2164132 RepID=UPI000E0C7F80|nr:ACP phosphodiesterase [Pleomorphovibrio marinus]